MSLIPKSAKKVFQGEIFTVWQWPQKLYDGSEATFEAIARPDYAGIVAVLPDNKILMVRDEQPHRSAVITTAGGRVEDNELPEAAAQRELLEETGYQAQQVVPWFTHEPLSKTNFKIHLFIGKGLQHVSEPKLEAGERVEPLILSFDEFLDLGQNEEMRDLYMRVRLLEAKFDPAKKEQLRQQLFE